MEPNFRPEFEIRAFEQGGTARFGINKLEGPNLDALQREVTWKLEERQKQMKSYLHTHKISIDEKAIHERVEKVMGLDENSLNELEKAVNAKLNQKKMELESLVKSR